MDLLLIDNAVVFNFLVDQKSIESIAVCETQAEAMRITSNIMAVPRDLLYAITWDFYK